MRSPDRTACPSDRTAPSRSTAAHRMPIPPAFRAVTSHRHSCGAGEHASHETFGHGGSQSSVGFADPQRGISAVICANAKPGADRNVVRMQRIASALYEDLCDGISPASSVCGGDGFGIESPATAHAALQEVLLRRDFSSRRSSVGAGSGPPAGGGWDDGTLSEGGGEREQWSQFAEVVAVQRYYSFSFH